MDQAAVAQPQQQSMLTVTGRVVCLALKLRRVFKDRALQGYITADRLWMWAGACSRTTYLCIDLDVQAHQIALSITNELVLHAGIPSAAALQLIKEVGHHLQLPTKV